MKLANLIVGLALVFGYGMAAPGCPADKVCLRPPTVIPVTLDEAYRLVDEGAGNWVFEGECTLTPRISWAQVKQIAAANGDGDAARVVISTATLDALGVHVPGTGTLDISEETLFGLAAQTVLRGAGLHGERVFCRPPGDKVALQGKTAANLLSKLAEYVR